MFAYLKCTLVTLTLMGFCLNTSFAQCPTISEFEIPFVCENLPFDSVFVVSTADSVQIVAFPFGAGIDPYTSPGGIVVDTLAIPASDTLLMAPFSHNVPSGFYIFYAIAHPTPTDPTCRPFDSRTVEIFEYIDYTTTDGSVCNGERFNLANQLSGVSGVNDVTFYNTLSDANNNANEIQEYDYPTSNKKYYVAVRASTSESLPDNCARIDSFSVNVLSPPNIMAGQDISLCQGETQQLSASGGVDYVWTPNIGLSDNTISDPIVDSDKTTTYVVTGIDANGCENIDELTVTIVPSPVCLPITSDQN